MMQEEIELLLDTVPEVLMEVLKQVKAVVQLEDRTLEHQLEPMDLAIVTAHKDQHDRITTVELNEEILILQETGQNLNPTEVLIQIQEEVHRQAITSKKQIRDLLITNHQTQEDLLIRNQALDLLTLK